MKIPPLKPQLALLVSAFSLYTLAFLVSGCSGLHPQRGGRAFTTGPIAQTLTQPENPAATSRQTQDTVRTRTYAIPFTSSLTLSPTLSFGSATSNFGSPNQNSKIQNQKSSATPLITVVEKEESHATTELGPSQHDSAREFAAKLSSLKSIVWVGLALFIFGIASLFWPPLKAIIGSVTTSVAIILGGLSLITLPTLIVGNELLILAGVMVAVGAWFLAHRHGQLRGQLTSRIRS